MRLALASLLLLLVACTSSSPPSAASQPLTASQILSSPMNSSLRDASFLLVEYVPVTGGGIHTAHGSGLLTLHPLALSYTVVIDPPLKPATAQFISLSGTDYSRWAIPPDSLGPWHPAPSTWVVSNPGAWPAFVAPALVPSPEGTLHVTAQPPVGAFSLWVRPSDSYPLLLETTDPDGTIFVYTFTAYNTGAAVSPAS